MQCKECGAVHRHRPPGGVAKGVKTTAVKRTSRKAASEALAADPHAPGLTLTNVLAQRRAKVLLESGKDYF